VVVSSSKENVAKDGHDPDEDTRKPCRCVGHWHWPYKIDPSPPGCGQALPHGGVSTTDTTNKGRQAGNDRVCGRTRIPMSRMCPDHEYGLEPCGARAVGTAKTIARKDGCETT